MADCSVPPFVGPKGERGEDLLIVWDIQNVRVPVDIPPDTILRYFYEQFVVLPGPRRCCGCYCTFTDSTKRAIGEKRFNSLTSNGVLNCCMLNVPGGDRKPDDADHPLKEVMLNFTVDCLKASKNGVILLITGDADFVRPAVWCKQQGCVKLELLYYDPCAAWEIKNMYVSWSMEWRDFLDRMVGERRNWIFPYPERSSDDESTSGSPTGYKHGKRNHQYHNNRFGKGRAGVMLRHTNKLYLADKSNAGLADKPHAGRHLPPNNWNGHYRDYRGMNYSRGDALLSCTPPTSNNMLLPDFCQPSIHMLPPPPPPSEPSAVVALPADPLPVVELVRQFERPRSFIERLQQAASIAGVDDDQQVTKRASCQESMCMDLPIRQLSGANLAVMVPGAPCCALTAPSGSSPPASPPSAISSSDQESPDMLEAGNVLKGMLNIPTSNGVFALESITMPQPVSRHSPRSILGAVPSPSSVIDARAISPPSPVELPSPVHLQVASKSLQQLLGVKSPVRNPSSQQLGTAASVSGACLLTPQHFQSAVMDVALSHGRPLAVLPRAHTDSGVSTLLTPAIAEACVKGPSGLPGPAPMSFGLTCGLLTPERVRDPWLTHRQSTALLTPSHISAQVCDG